MNEPVRSRLTSFSGARLTNKLQKCAVTFAVGRAKHSRQKKTAIKEVFKEELSDGYG